VVVVMKMDIEGMEYTMIPALLVGGAICSVDFSFTEFHLSHGDLVKAPSNLLATLNWILKSTPKCPTQFVSVDDESYSESHFPLPGDISQLNQPLPVLSSDMAHKRCVDLLKDFKVSPGLSWGTMPVHLQEEWKRIGCDVKFA
jgi:hypothetical protein